jgi:hypothetical protein
MPELALDLVLLLGSAFISALIWARSQDFTWAPVWLIGSIFGLALGVSRLDADDIRLAVAIASSGAFMLAVLIAQPIVARAPVEPFRALTKRERIEEWFWFTVAGALAGAAGSTTVSIALKASVGVPISVGVEAVQALVGAVCGVLFMRSWPSQHQFVQHLVRFLVWQVPVGLLLGWTIDSIPPADRSLAFQSQFRAFLSGPTVELVAVIGAIASIVALFRRDTRT